MSAWSTSYTTKVYPKALEKHFFLLCVLVARSLAALGGGLVVGSCGRLVTASGLGPLPLLVAGLAGVVVWLVRWSRCWAVRVVFGVWGFLANPGGGSWVVLPVIPSWDLPLGSLGGSSSFLTDGLMLVLVGRGSPALYLLVPRAGVCGARCVVRMCFCVSCVLAAPVLLLVWVWRGWFLCVRWCVCGCVCCVSLGGLRVLVPASPGSGLRLLWAPVCGCSSPPFRAGVRWRRRWLVPRISWLRALGAVPPHSSLESVAGGVELCFVCVRGVRCVRAHVVVCGVVFVVPLVVFLVFVFVWWWHVCPCCMCGCVCVFWVDPGSSG